MTTEQLKALCYDQIVVFNQAQANINVLQAEITKRQQNPSAGTSPSPDV